MADSQAARATHPPAPCCPTSSPSTTHPPAPCCPTPSPPQLAEVNRWLEQRGLDTTGHLKDGIEVRRATLQVQEKGPRSTLALRAPGGHA